MFLVILGNQAKKDLKNLDARSKDKVLRNLRALKNNPFLGEKMVGQFQGSYRIKIPPLRIIYLPDFKNKIIWIRAIGFRGKIYKKS